MRIAINGRFLGQKITGVQRVCREFTLAFDRLLARGDLPGVKARVIAPAADAIEDPGYRSIELVRAGRRRGYAWEQLELSSAAGTDILLSLANLAPISRLIARPRSNVVLVHDLSYAYFPAAYSLPFRATYTVVMQFVMRRAGRVITVSQSERAAILEHFPNVPSLPNRLVAVPNGVSLPDDRESTAPIPREDFGLYVGSLSKRKNIEGAITAAIHLARERDMRFVFVGGASGVFAGANVDIPSDVAHKLKFVGQIDEAATLADYYRRAAVLLFPSHYESSGLPPTEAMSYGCPVVLSRIPSLVERCGDAAEYCDPNDVNSIVDAVKRVVTDPLRAETLSRAGRERAALYSWEAQVRGVLAEAARLDVTQ